MKVRVFIIAIISFFIYQHSYSQEVWSLSKCVDYALKNNIQIKQQEISSKIDRNVLNQSVIGILPSLNGNASDNNNYGRSVDRFTNQIFETHVHTQNFSVSSQMTLFNGLQTFNTIRQNRFNLLASLQDIKKMKNDISLTVATSYLQILFNEELLESSKKQLDVTKQQVTRTKLLVDAGSLPQGSFLEILAQQSSEELSVITSDNLLKSAYLNLVQLLDLDSTSNFKVERPVLQEPSLNDEFAPVSKIYDEALVLPQIKSAEYNLLSAETGQYIAYGRLSPRLSLSGSFSTGYSDARTKSGDPVVGAPVPIGYVGSSGETVYTASVSRPTLEYPFKDQIKDNQSKSLSLSLSVPIFNGWQVMGGISSSSLNVKNYNYNLQLARNLLYKDIQQARNDVIASKNKYLASKKTLEAYKESFNYTQNKFDVGMVTSVDYNIQKNKLIKAESDLLQAKYEFIFKKNILNFYRGLPIKLE
jgi:outer membrane protein